MNITLYSDLKQSSTYKVPYIYNIESIEQSITNILVTTPGERIFLPEFGAGLRRFLFEFATDANAFMMLNNVISAIKKWETRIVINESKSQVMAEPDYNRYIIDLYFSIPSLGVDEYNYKRTATVEVSA